MLERRVQDIVNDLGRALMKDVLELADTASAEVTIDGVRWGYRRVQSGTYETTFGEVVQPRSTYQRAGRGRVSIPMELRLGIVEGRYTPLVARIANRSLASMPTGEAEQLPQEIGVCRLSRSTLHRLPQALLAKVDPRLDEIDAHIRASDSIPAQARSVQVALDGVMVPMEGEDAKPRGRKTDKASAPRHETKYGVHGQTGGEGEGDQADDVDDGADATSAPAQDTQGLVWREAGVGTISFWDQEGDLLKTIYLGEMPAYRKEPLAARLQTEFAAVMSERPDLRVVLASDGAPTQWDLLRTLADRVLGDGPRVELLDYFHCASRLGTAADAIWGKGQEEAIVNGEHWKTVLRERERGATLVLKSLEHQRSIADEAGNKDTTATVDRSYKYIAKHKKAGRLNYAAAKKDHLPIGTGVTEAAAKTLVAVRMKRSGARYETHGGHTIITLRAALLSQRFDAFSSELEAMYSARIAA